MLKYDQMGIKTECIIKCATDPVPLPIETSGHACHFLTDHDQWYVYVLPRTPVADIEDRLEISELLSDTLR